MNLSNQRGGSGGRGSGRCIKVELPARIQDYYKKADKISRSDVSTSWVKDIPTVSQNIGELVRDSQRRGLFAKTGFEYAVFLLGPRLFSSKNPGIEDIIKDLYAEGFNKVQHGVFATVERSVNAAKDFQNSKIVADELAKIFNDNPEKSWAVRKQWMHGLVPHDGMFFGKDLMRECSLLINEYIKHGPSLGLCLEDYIDFTSTLFKHCDPDFADWDNSFSDFADWDNSFSKETLIANLRLLSQSNQPVPYKVITQCNKKHDFCILTEFRYQFDWKNNDLVSYEPSTIDVRLDYCSNSNADHTFNYLTQQNLNLVQTKIIKDPLYGFGKIEDVAQPDLRGSGGNYGRTRGGGGGLGDGEEQHRPRLVLDKLSSGQSSRPGSAQSERDGEGGVALQQGVMKAKVNLFGDSKPREVLLEEKGLDWKKIDLGWEHIDRKKY